METVRVDVFISCGGACLRDMRVMLTVMRDCESMGGTTRMEIGPRQSDLSARWSALERVRFSCQVTARVSTTY